MYYLYRHIRLDTELPFYVGIGKLGNKGYSRAYIKYNRSYEWKEIMKTFDYRVEIVFHAETLDEIYNKEKEFIKLYQHHGLVNKTKGGGGILGYNVSNKVKERLSEINKGENHPQFGTKASKETRLKQSFIKRGGNNINSKKCVCIETGEVFDSFGEAASKLYKDESKYKKISDIIKGRRKTHLGLSFRLYNNEK